MKMENGGTARRGKQKIRNGTHLSDIVEDLTLYFYHPTLLIIIFYFGVISLVSWAIEGDPPRIYIITHK